MSLENAALGGLEALINRAINADEVSRESLASFYGKHIEFRTYLKHDIRFGFGFGPEGVYLYSEGEYTPDAVIEGGPASLLRNAKNPHEKTGVRISGDALLVERFVALMSAWEPDWQSRLSGVAGDTLTFRVEQLVEKLNGFSQALIDKGHTDGGDYLREEARMLAGPVEAEQFADEVDELAAAADRLDARIARLESALKSESGK